MDNKGQTLLEIVIALGVMIFGIVSVLSLTTRGISTTRTSTNRLIASNLAREGVEVVRGIRDSNWLAKNPWDQGIYRSHQNKAIPIFDPATGAWSLLFLPNGSTIMDYPVYIDDGMYRQFTGQSFGTEDSGFYRLLTFEFIDRAVSGLAEPVRIGVKVESRVQWKEKNQTKQLEFEEELYNWR
ncbi:MAG TPA: hypothetical protein VJA22_00535 [Patescibacteria group bacterium]|nr:hypothetical protein [Patescibacteria group bacterium]